MSRFERRRKPREDDIHDLLVRWGIWRICPHYWDHEVRKADCHMPFGPTIPPGVPIRQPTQEERNEYWKISEFYDRWHRKSVIRDAIELAYLQGEVVLSLREIALIMEVSHEAAGKYIEAGRKRIQHFIRPPEQRQSAA